MPRRHPSSTLFPYTTLFRSGRSQPARSVMVLAVAEDSPSANIAEVRPATRGHHKVFLGMAAGVGKTYQDRKSTRLNSSHVEISYAVFCLKKQTVAINEQHRR